MKAYISGPMRGIDHWNFEAFDGCAAWLRGIGWEVVSPAEHDREVDPDCVDLPQYDHGDEIGQGTFHKLIGWDLMVIADPGPAKIDAIVLLPGWEPSVGVAHELYVARALGKEVCEFVQRPGKPQQWLTLLSPHEQSQRQHLAKVTA